MSEQETRDFLAQFDRAREEIKTWPKWMQDAARYESAHFPRPPRDHSGAPVRVTAADPQRNEGGQG